MANTEINQQLITKKLPVISVLVITSIRIFKKNIYFNKRLIELFEMLSSSGKEFLFER